MGPLSQSACHHWHGYLLAAAAIIIINCCSNATPIRGSAVQVADDVAAADEVDAAAATLLSATSAHQLGFCVQKAKLCVC